MVLLADDLGYGELGCQGNPQIPTPHIDSLAADGLAAGNLVRGASGARVLYDLREDVAETTILAIERREQLQELSSTRQSLDRKMAPPALR